MDNKSTQTWNSLFSRLKRLIFFTLVIFTLTGNIIDIFASSIILISPVFITNISYIFVTFFILIFYLLKVLPLRVSSAIIIYALILNIFIGLLFNIYSVDFDKLLLREFLFLSIIIITGGFLIDKYNVLIIGSILLVYFISLVIYTKSDFLSQNIAIITMLIFFHTAWIFYLFRLIERGYIRYQNLLVQVKEQNNELTSQKEKLQIVNSTKDKLFSIISHDLKTPCGIILNFSNLLIESAKSKNLEKIEKYSLLIKTAAIVTNNLIFNLLDWSRSQSGKLQFNPEEISPANLINDIVKFLQSYIKHKEISIYQEIDSTILLKADKHMLYAIFRNLLSNAIKYTPTHGAITITAKKNASETIFEVRDTGVGIDENVKSKLFDLSFTLSSTGINKEVGTGLGLYICKDFVEKHGGKIWVDSEVGEGSTFYFSIA